MRKESEKAVKNRRHFLSLFSVNSSFFNLTAQMDIQFSFLRRRVRQFLFHLPFTINFIVFVSITGASYLIYTLPGNEHNSFTPVLLVILNIAFWFSISLITASLIPVLFSWFYLILQAKKNKIVFQIAAETVLFEEEEKQKVHIKLLPVIKPLFGFIKVRLEYDAGTFSDKFPVIQDEKDTLFSKELEGEYYWVLPQIKEYALKKVFIYFEDAFQFFSFVITTPVNSTFHTVPSIKKVEELLVTPRKTEQNNVRINKLKKVEGEYLNYKSFESSDDVRRIVWKIFARNKELVVRIPETLDTYASHLYIYCSFYSIFKPNNNDILDVPFLNYFKTISWSIYNQLNNDSFQIKWIPDQAISNHSSSNDSDMVKYAVSTSNWHQQKDLKTYLKTGDASIVIISSLSDADDVRQLMDELGSEVAFVLVKLTNSFKVKPIADWLQWIFITSDQAQLDQYKRQWLVSPLRKKIIDNEKKLEAVLSLNQQPIVV